MASSTRTVTILVLLALVVTAHFGMYELAKSNGTFSLPTIFSYSTRILPATKIPHHLPQTGIAPVDNYLAFMVSVFWVDLNPANYRAHIQGHHFLGTLSSTWLLMLLETHRGRRGGWFYYATYAMEVIGELSGLGLFTPLWCIVHLLTTPAPSASKPSADALLVRDRTLGPLGWSLLLGHVAPTLAMAFTKPDATSLLLSQQAWIVIRLFHPVLSFTLWKLFLSFTSRGPSKRPLWLRAADTRKVYTFSMLFSALHHLTSLAIIFAEHWIPGFVKAEVLAALGPRGTLLPFPFWIAEHATRKVTFAEGVGYFLQWDELLTAAAAIVWATALYLEASSLVKGGRSLNTVAQTLALGVFAGPVAAAAFLLQERDNFVFAAATAEAAQEIKKKL